MHPALHIQEILHEMCEEICPPSTSDDLTEWAWEGCSTLLSFALTCKTTCDPALDRLWWSMGDLTPLFKLIPGFISGPPGYFTTYPTPESDFRTFNSYAKRIYFYHCQSEEEILTSAYFQVIQARNQQPILPRLRYLYAEAATPELPLLCCPSLLSLCITNKLGNASTKPHYWAAINSLPQTAPRLQSLDLGEGADIPGTCLDAIANMNNLKRLYFRTEYSDHLTHSLDAKSIMKLSTMKNLEHLVFEGNLDIARESQSSARLPFFPSLTKLEIYSTEYTIFRVSNMLRLGRFEQLEYLQLVANISQSSSSDGQQVTVGLQTIFKALRASTSSAFTSLTIDFPELSQKITLSKIPDLLTLRLTELRITEPLFTSLSHNDIAHMIVAWPALKVLELAAQEWNTQFVTLLLIATKLPSLTKLVFGVRVHDFPPVKSVPLLSHPLRELELVAVDGSTKKPAAQFAQLIDKIFPFADKFQLSILYDSEFETPNWARDVVAVHLALQTARSDQMRRAALSNQ